MTKDQLEYWRSLGFPFDEFYDGVAERNQKKKDKLDQEQQEIKQKSTSKPEVLEAVTNTGGNKKPINLLICLEQFAKLQFDDTLNNIWEVRQMSSFANIETLRDLNKIFEYKTICVVHHGNLFSDKSLGDNEKVNLGHAIFDAITKIIATVKKPELDEISDDYINTVIEKSKEMYKNVPESSIKGYFGLKILFKQLLKNGCFFSVSCLEADGNDFLNDFATFAVTDIKIFANSNYSNIQLKRDYPVGSPNPVIVGYGSILNSFLSSPWKDSNGWRYYDVAQKKIITTKKDLWLFSRHPKKIFELVSRKNNLTEEQALKEYYAQQYFSKKFKSGFIKNYGESKYKAFVKQVEATYPEFNK